MTDDFSEHLDVEDTSVDSPTDPEAEVEQPPAAEAVERTGNPAVDRVLESLDGLADTPVAEHVAVFEAAHDQLRGALAGAGEATSQPRG